MPGGRSAALCFRWRGTAGLPAPARPLCRRGRAPAAGPDPPGPEHAAQGRPRDPAGDQVRPRTAAHPRGGAHHLQRRGGRAAQLPRRRQFLHHQAGQLQRHARHGAQPGEVLAGNGGPAAGQRGQQIMMSLSRPLRVLVVDDDREDFLILRDLLSDLPNFRFELDWASSLAEGLRSLAEDRHDVYLVDWHLGPDSGLDMLKAALTPGRPRRPVIMLTGQGNPDLDMKALEAGAADYLVKGQTDAETLARAHRDATKHARQLAELEDSRLRYRLLFELNPFPTWVYEIDSWRLVAVNDAMVENYGYSRKELLGMTVFDLREPDEV